MTPLVYVDTSALAKWYLNEQRSADVESYIQQNGPVAISDLTIVEMRSLLARRRRERDITPGVEGQVFAAFQDDVRQRFLLSHPLPAEWAAAAVNLLSAVPNVPLRTLDAMHLLVACEISADVLATADRVMASGARGVGLSVAGFW